MSVLRLLGACALVCIAACQPSVGTSAKTSANRPVSDSAQALGVLPAHCENISLQMSAITNRSDVQSLAVVNQALKKCVPEVNDTVRKQWLEDSYAMYQRFLDLQVTDKTNGVWDEFSWTLEGHAEETAEERQARLQQQKEIWPKLNDRMKQMSQWLGQEYIDNFYLGEGMLDLRRSPQYIIDIFAPYMPEHEQAFVTQMGTENLSLTTNDAAIVISWPELAKRALFWEQYSQRFPDSPYVKFAQYQFQWYRAALYHGSDNTPFIDHYSDKLFIVPEALTTHQQLAENKDSQLAKKSQLALQWLAANDSKWATLSEAEREQAQKDYDRLVKAPYPDPVPGKEKNQYYDCHSDAICHVYTREY